jgi:diguanylate cyclase (GGDEF)-like protein
MKPKVAATLPWSRSGRDLAADVRWELRHQLNTVASYAQWTLVPVVLLTLSALWPHMKHDTLLNWAGMAATQMVGSVWNSHINRKRLQEQNSGDNFLLRNSLYFGLAGLVWGFLPLFAAVGGDERAYWMALLIGSVIVTLLALILSTSHRIFYSALAAATVPVVASLFTGPGFTPQLLALGLIYLVALVAVHNTLYQVHLDRVHAALRNEAHAAALANRLEHHDALTGLYNRTGLLRWLQLFPFTPGYRAITLVLGNIKGFADINLLHGASVGDTLLVEVARRLVQLAGDQVCVARLNGAEFLLVDARPDANSESLAGILATLEKEDFLISDRRINISFQQCTLQGRPATIDTLLETARNRLQQGPAEAQRHPELGEQALLRRRALVTGFHQALHEGAIQPWFQPIIHCQDNHIIGWEALARWQHPERGVLLPDEFMEIARVSGHMRELTQAMCDQSLRFAALLAREPGLAEQGISINFSIADLSSPDLLDWLPACLARHAVAATRLRIEISEREVLLQDRQLGLNLEGLKELGVLLAIDDFGTGYANIGQLLDLPADIVKLDKRFIRQLPAAGQGGTLVRAIIGMAQGMGKTTIAEGVENREQLDFLRSAGCTAYQGFLAGAALPEREACELARGWRGH